MMLLLSNLRQGGTREGQVTVYAWGGPDRASPARRSARLGMSAPPRATVERHRCGCRGERSSSYFAREVLQGRRFAADEADTEVLHRREDPPVPSSSVATVPRAPECSARLRSMLWTTFACWECD